MTGRDHEYAPGGPDIDGEPLARELERALAKFSAVEPRVGLEQRILANLRAEQARVPSRSWWRWGVAVGVAAAVVVALVVGSRAGNSSRPVVVNHPSTSAPGSNRTHIDVAANGGTNDPRPVRPVSRRRTIVRAPAVVAAADPKVDQFPSPQPLTGEELALARYVQSFPREAMLMAQVQEEFELEMQKEMNGTGSETRTSGSIQKER